MPGIATRPPRSNCCVVRAASRAISVDVPIAEILSPTMASASTQGRAESPVKIRPFNSTLVGACALNPETSIVTRATEAQTFQDDRSMFDMVHMVQAPEQFFRRNQ